MSPEWVWRVFTEEVVRTGQRKFFTFKRLKLVFFFFKDFQAEELSVRACCQLSMCLEQTRRGEAQYGQQVIFVTEGSSKGGRVPWGC